MRLFETMRSEASVDTYIPGDPHPSALRPSIDPAPQLTERTILLN